MKSRFKLPYEPPQIIDLGGVAHAAKSTTTVPGTACQPGGSPYTNCATGSTASGGQCQPGSSTGSACVGGSVPQTTSCQPGSVAGNECKKGGVAGTGCKLGTAPV